MHDQIAVIIPTYNEKENIVSLLKSILEILPSGRIFVVDDSSPDGTAFEVQNLSYEDDRIRLIVRSQKEGLGSAYLDAFARIIPDDSIKYLITMDADFSHDPADLAKFLEHIEAYDLVIGSRYVPGGDVQNWNLSRRILSRVANIYAKTITDVPIADLTAGFVSYEREMLWRILTRFVKSDGYAFQIEMKYLAYQLGARIKEVPITFRERINGKSKLLHGGICEGISTPWQLRLFRKL